jgi:predicted DNA-binding WGR domain protein
MDWRDPPPGFTHILFERAAADEYRFYYLSWQPLLFGQALVRIYGRRGHSQKTLTTYFDDLDQAWPTIRKTIRRRLAQNYRIVEPAGWSNPSPVSNSPDMSP